MDRLLDILGRVQFWLQGHGYPPPYRPRLAVIVGDAISDLRYAAWRRWGSDRHLYD